MTRSQIAPRPPRLEAGALSLIEWGPRLMLSRVMTFDFCAPAASSVMISRCVALLKLNSTMSLPDCTRPVTNGNWTRRHPHPDKAVGIFRWIIRPVPFSFEKLETGFHRQLRQLNAEMSNATAVSESGHSANEAIESERSHTTSPTALFHLLRRAEHVEPGTPWRRVVLICRAGASRDP